MGHQGNQQDSLSNRSVGSHLKGHNKQAIMSFVKYIYCLYGRTLSDVHGLIVYIAKLLNKQYQHYKKLVVYS